MKASEFIKSEVQKVLEQIGPVDLTQPHTIARNLVFLFHTMKASEHLLEVAIDKSDWGTVLNTYFRQHLDEERNHDQWLARDLKTKGIDAASSICPRQAVELVGSQYYLLNYVNPVCLLGYLLLMEGFSMSLDTVALLEHAHGTDLLRTLRYHAEHDIDHSQELYQIIDELTDDEKTLVLQSAVQSAMYFAEAVKTFR